MSCQIENIIPFTVSVGVKKVCCIKIKDVEEFEFVVFVSNLAIIFVNMVNIAHCHQTKKPLS